MTAKKKAPAKKKAAKRKVVKKKAPPKRKVAKKKVVKKKVPAKKRVRNKKPIPKYHLNHQSWDKTAVIKILCERIASSSKGLKTICDDDKDLPSISCFMNWFDAEAKAGGGPLLERYARAKEMQADYMADEIIDISDNQVSEPLCIDGVPVVVKGELIRVTTPASVNHARLRTDNRKWVASKLKPGKYGDKLELSGNPDRPLAGMTDEQLALRRKQLEDKLAEHGAD